ncbi:MULTISPECIES: cache domain-containing protein [unclassified Pseudomonas]|uniref:cache domain-containing protein n=1 Tax=unclassified Pseudomonas TaxID=196821 RepID=UPI000B50A672|nr:MULTISPECIES: cache domain-containing protein [unclassified Pseudomonas]TFA88949.1 hypothetical protein F473_02326 [Pseudomonas sp. URIL14HWK12:I1]SNB73800.1 hypothetical protein SAMN02746026_02371 [Pseudomonas sp. LAIL14HWK12:I4]
MLKPLVDSASAVFDSTFTELEKLASRFELLISSSKNTKKSISESGLSKIRPDMVRSLTSVGVYAYALGIVLDEGVIEDSPFWLNWIEIDSDGIINNDSNIRYPWRGNFYEYPNADWMVIPKTQRCPAIVGPYVDFDKHIITLATPIVVQDRFLGVSAADIRLSDFERIVATPLSRIGRDCLLCNHEGRVVVSNTASAPVGSLNPAYLGAGETVSTTGWRAIILD